MVNVLNRFDRHYLALIAIVALGFALRINGINWDQGLYLHPDERFIAIVSNDRIDFPVRDPAALLTPESSPLNPRRNDPDGNPMSFAYGTLPVYVQSSVSWIVNLVADRDYQSYALIYKVGRPLTVFLDTLTIFLVYLLGRRVFHAGAGLVAAALYALAVLPIQLSHFFTVDVWLTSFVTLALLMALRFMDAPTPGRAIAMALPVGCAFATKASVPSLLLPLFVAAGYAVWRSTRRARAIGALSIAAIVSLAIFSLFEPYAIVRSGPFIEDIRTQARIVRGQFDVPFTRQFVGLTPGLYELRNLFLFGMGPGLMLASLIGLIFSARRAVTERQMPLMILIAWIAAYVPTLLTTEARFLRYSLPMVPVLAVFAAGLLTQPVPRHLLFLKRLAIVGVVGITAVWAIGFSSIYSGEHPRIAASQWMIANIPPGSAISVETWDDALPLPYPGAPPAQYEQVPFDIYADAPPEEKAVTIAETLQQVDYVVLSSDRVIDSVDNLPWRYAVQNDYYRRLTNGQLGFQLVYEGTQRPELFGITVDDSSADESFTVYDHPRVRIYKKVTPLSRGEIRDRLLWGISQEWSPTRYPFEQQLTLGEPVSEITTTDDASWNELATQNTPLAILAWLLAVEVIGLAVLPLAAVILRRTPDRGALSARLLGIILLGWIGWIGGSLGWWESRTTAIGSALVLIALATWGTWWYRRRRGSATVLPSVRVWGACATAWIGLFTPFLLLRAIYPDFWQTWFGGEKPFELAYLRAIAASTSFPPYDPWYADGTINYYYYGWHLIATVTKLSGVGVSLGFQLAAATIVALFGLQVASLGSMLAVRRHFPTLRSAMVGGVLVLTSVLLIGNLDGLRQVIEAGGVRGDTFDFWRSTRVIDFTINEFPYFSAIWADVHPHVINFSVVALLLTVLCQVGLDGPWSGVRRAWPQMAIIPLVLGTIGVTNSWDVPLSTAMTVALLGYVGFLRSRRDGLVAGGVGILVAASSFVLFLPFYRGFYSVVQGVKPASAGSPLGDFLTVWGIFFGIVTIVLIARAYRLKQDERLWRTAAVMSLLVIAPGSTVIVVLAMTGTSSPGPSSLVALVLAAGIVGLSSVAARLWSLPLAALVAVVALASTTGIVAAPRPAASVALSFTFAGIAMALYCRRAPQWMIPWALLAIGSVTIASTEIVFVVDDLQGGDWERMNTVFKFYLQAWTLLAVATGALLSRLWLPLLRDRSDAAVRVAPLGIIAEPVAQATERRESQQRSSLQRARLVPATASAVVLALGLIYPVLGTPARLSWDMPSSPTELTLDGYAWMNGGTIQNGTGETITFTGDLAAIEWLDDNANGTPVILEASIGPYRGNGARISSATGLPAVLGWDRHQRQQRYLPGIDRRMDDVRAMYNEIDPATKLEMLRRYDVRYIIVGDVERKWNSAENPDPYASAAGLNAFDRLTGQGLQLVFDSGSTRIYEVVEFERLLPAANAIHD